MTPAERMCHIICEVAARDTLRRLTFSKPTGDMPPRITARVVNARGRIHMALEETRTDGKVHHSALLPAEWADKLLPLIQSYGQVNLSGGAGDVEFRTSKKGKVTLIGAGPAEAKLAGEQTPFERFSEELNRKKNYILTGSEPFLIHLGVSDKTGRIHDKKQGKYRQINRFLEHVSDIYGALPGDGTLHIYDLCCGKSYLSFAVYHYLHHIRGRDVDMLCMDLKEDVIRDCAGIASAAGFTGMHFVAGDIREVPFDTVPDLVISLHACDIATDIVLRTAVTRGAKVILSTPCCHRTLSRHVETPSLKFVTDYPHLKDKLSEVLTDALRLSYLKANGYTVAAPELTDPDDTPKNTLLRAVKRQGFQPESREGTRLTAEYQALLTLLFGEHVQDYLKDTLML